jgi:hypothetical protein
MWFSKAWVADSTRSLALVPRGKARWLVTLLATVIVALSIIVLIAALAPTTSVQAGSNAVRVKAYYLALGTSLAYGQQPSPPADFDHGYPQQWFGLLQEQGSQSLTNYGCPGMTSSQMFTVPDCSWVDPYDPSHPSLSSHDPYNGQTQLGAALAFIAAHPHQVSPVSLDMGSNDLLPLFQPRFTGTGWDCSYDATAVANAEATLDANLQDTILPELVQALQNKGGQLTGDLVMMNYYFPFQNVCPQTLPAFEDFNSRLAHDAAVVAAEYHVRIPIADVFTAFGGATVPNPNLCTYTWFCPFQSFDPHATTTGYGVIAQTFNSLVDNG